MVSDLQLERERRARHRFAATTRQATLHASPEEQWQITALLDAVHAGTVTRDDAHAALAALQRQHQEAA